MQRRSRSQRESCVFSQVRKEASSLPSLNRQAMNPCSIDDAVRLVCETLQGENINLPASTCSGGDSTAHARILVVVRMNNCNKVWLRRRRLGVIAVVDQRGDPHASLAIPERWCL
jgi:hypothetical protein